MKQGFRILWLLIAIVSETATLLQVAQSASACSPLFVPSFGRLLVGSTDITQSQNAVNITEGDTVIVQCAEGYQLVHSNTSTLLGMSSVTQCGGSGTWSVNVTELACIYNIIESAPILSNFFIMVIVAAVLAVLSLLLLTTTIACAVRAQRLKRELLEATYVENEIAFARSQGAFTLSNPLAVVKDEDSVTVKPLYLTPDEMSEFEEKQKIY